MTFVVALASFAGGYALAITTWPKVRAWCNGAAAEIEHLKAKIDDLKAKL